MQNNFLKTRYFILILFYITSCNKDEGIFVPIDERIGALPEFVINPIDNPTTPEKVELGKKLF